VKYLLDVNALVALGFREHSFHLRVAKWVASLAAAAAKPDLATCSITELGFVRILSQLPEFDISVANAKDFLAALQRDPRANFTLLVDHHGVERLPKWMKSPKQITDGHLTELAKAAGAILATLDRSIPGAFLIP
jgi:predicted nucleic acid-binding protein